MTADWKQPSYDSAPPHLFPECSLAWSSAEIYSPPCSHGNRKEVDLTEKTCSESEGVVELFSAPFHLFLVV